MSKKTSSRYKSARPDDRARPRRRVWPVMLAVLVGFGLIAGVAFAVSTSSSGSGSGETVVAGQGGHWTNVTPDRLAQMLQNKDFTLIDVKTPYIGEIQGTDLWIPYDQLAAQAAKLPASKSAKILVYCRSGVQSAMAAQTLLDLGYTNVWNLDGGMQAWQNSGRAIINLNRG